MHSNALDRIRGAGLSQAPLIDHGASWGTSGMKRITWLAMAAALLLAAPAHAANWRTRHACDILLKRNYHPSVEACLESVRQVRLEVCRIRHDKGLRTARRWCHPKL